MRRVVTHPLILVVLAILGLYVLLAGFIEPPIPKSLLIQFMVVGSIGVLLVATFDDATCARLFTPIRHLLGSPGLRPWRMLALIATVLFTATIAYQWINPDLAAPPVELRSVHPAPPNSLQVYDRRFDLVALENPLRDREGSEAYGAAIDEGAEIYYRNCVFCHGDNLDGRGHFAVGFNPRPANFQDVGTIAQLQESYLFWRITTGGPGLPREGAPWASAMPVWHETLTEDDVWKVITFLYDYTGFEPRSFELKEGTDSTEVASVDDPDASSSESIEAVYSRRCAQCHGSDGEGDGPAAELMYPLPRDFSIGLFKYKTTHADSEFPYDDDLRKTIREGLPGTSMPPWAEILSDARIDGLVGLIREFGAWDGESEEDLGIEPIELGEPTESSPESVARGAEQFKKACVQCHGEKGRGNVTSGKKLTDDWGNRIWPRNLTRPGTWRWTNSATDVFQRISTGIRGTPMPEHTTNVSAQDRWDIANYVMTLREETTPLALGETVVRGTRIDGPLPDEPGDPMWQMATPIVFPLIPNIVKEPRLFFSLNDTVSVRALFNDENLALRLDVDDRTYSVPGHEEELLYRHEEIEPTRDAVAVQFPAEVLPTSEKPWFRHGDPAHPVNIWYWQAPSLAPAAADEAILLDATGPDRPLVPREGSEDLFGAGVWEHGQWRVVLSRPLISEDPRDLAFEIGQYTPIAFGNWDGWAGERGSRHTLTPWYWLLLEPEEQLLLTYSSSAGAGALAGLVFLVVARRQRQRFGTAQDDDEIAA